MLCIHDGPCTWNKFCSMFDLIFCPKSSNTNLYLVLILIQAGMYHIFWSIWKDTSTLLTSVSSRCSGSPSRKSSQKCTTFYLSYVFRVSARLANRASLLIFGTKKKGFYINDNLNIYNCFRLCINLKLKHATDHLNFHFN